MNPFLALVIGVVAGVMLRHVFDQWVWLPLVKLGGRILGQPSDKNKGD